jgi:hypothetical protein
MEDHRKGFERFLKLTEPWFNRTFGPGKISRFDLDMLFSYALVCSFDDERFCILKYVGPENEKKDPALTHQPFMEKLQDLVKKEDPDWKIMDEYNDLSLDEAVDLCVQLNHST